MAGSAVSQDQVLLGPTRAATPSVAFVPLSLALPPANPTLPVLLAPPSISSPLRAAVGPATSCLPAAAAAIVGAAVAARGRRGARRKVLQRSAVRSGLDESTWPVGPMESLGQDEPGSALALVGRTISKEVDQALIALKAAAEPFASVGDWLQSALGRKQSLSPTPEPLPFVQSLTLDVAKVVEKEELRGRPPSTPLVRGVFYALSWTLDQIYEGRPIPKFWVLETVARLPYFSYISVLHLYETLGWWRTPQLRELHQAEENNELHHLLIMESLGGSRHWFDRLVAQNASLGYYWVVVLLFMLNPSLAYNFSLLVEEHAHATYAAFVEANEEILRKIPPPPIATAYYQTGDLYNFDKFQTSRESNAPPRRPPCDNMYDVFCNIRDDELEHVSTMRACQDWWGGTGPSPLRGAELQAMGAREDWRRWAEQVASLPAAEKQ